MANDNDTEILAMIDSNADYLHEQSMKLTQLIERENDAARRLQLNRSLMLQLTLEKLFLVSRWNLHSIISIKSSLEKLPVEFQEVKSLVNAHGEQIKQTLLPIKKANDELKRLQDEGHDIYG